MADREVVIYNEPAEDFEEIYIFTYWNESDKQYEHYFEDNVSICPKKGISNNILYSVFLPLIYWPIIRRTTILKTNQMRGSWSAVIASWISSGKLVVQTGYILSLFDRNKGEPPYFSTIIELISYFFADGIITSSKTGYEYVEEKYNPSALHDMIPNYIDTELFCPRERDIVADLCFVGRLEEQKNVKMLIRAVGDTGYSLSIYGEGSQREDLERLAERVDADVNFCGQVRNNKIPDELNKHRAFALSSRYEGMPKTLLEAMACGLPVIGTDVEGIQEVIDDRQTGNLCDPELQELITAIDEIFTDKRKRKNLGENARRDY
jgi:glycosyltransferase involved in cell wall biosynthesis